MRIHIYVLAFVFFSQALNNTVYKILIYAKKKKQWIKVVVAYISKSISKEFELYVIIIS